MNKIWARLGATLVLLLLLVGAPACLVAFGRLDLIASMRWPDIVTQPDDGSLLLVALTLVGWAAWVVVAVCFVVELLAVWSNRKIRLRLPGVAWVQSAVGVLIAVSVGASVVAPVVAAAAPIEQVAAGTPRVETDDRESPAPAPTPLPGRVHVVAQGEDLWSLATTYFGDGGRWREIVAANDSVVLDPLQDLAPGTVLVIPGLVSESATATPEAQPESTPAENSSPTTSEVGDVTVQEGDTLWDIADDRLGDPERWPEIYAANSDVIADPDLIYPGWTLRLPASATATPTASTRVTRPNDRQPNPSQHAQPTPTPAPVPAEPPASPMTPATAGEGRPSATDVEASTVASRDELVAVSNLDADLARLVLGLVPAVAAGLLGVVSFRRSTQLNRRKLGRRIPSLTPQAAMLEQALDRVAALEEPAPRRAAPSSGSIPIGLSADESPVFLDVEESGVTSILGDTRECAVEFAAGLVTSVMGCVWLDETHIVIPESFGWSRAFDNPRLRVAVDARDAIRELSRLAGQRRARLDHDLDELRSKPDVCEAWDTVIFVLDELPHDAVLPESAALRALGIGVVVVGAEVPGSRVIHVGSDRARDDDIGVFVPTLLSAPARRALVELIETTGSDETTPAPWWDVGWHPPELRLVPDPAPDMRKEETMDIPIDHAPHLRLLGPVELVGARGCLPSRAVKQCIEYCAWILFHPGRTATTMASSLLVAEGTRRSNMSRLRTWLGSDDHGEAYLPDAYCGRIALHPDVTSDWERLGLLIQGGVNRASDSALRAALDLVRGAPLADAAPGQWHWAEEMRCDMVSTIRDIGAVLAQRALDQGDVDLARWAAARALSASPEDETLMGLRIMTEHRAGNHQEVERLVLHLTRSARAIGVDLSDETVTLLQEVMEGRARARFA